MKTLNVSVIIALLVVCTPVAAGQEPSSSDDVRRLTFDPTLTLKLRVTSDYQASDVRLRKLESEISFWTIAEIRVRIFKTLTAKDYTSSDKSRPGRSPGYKYLIERAHFEINWPYNPYMLDPYRSFFRESDFLFRSTRSLHHEYYSSGGYYHN